jgi:hypothetical protein
MPNYNISQSNNYIIYTDQTGSSIFDSGGPSGGYSNSENIFFLIAPAYSTGTLTLNITSFASQVSTDYLRIYDRYVPTASFSYSGVTAGTASLLAAINGSPSVPITVTSSTGKAYLRWSSDSATTGSGFALSWTGSGIYSVDSSSGVVLNQYAATFPRTASSSSYITIPKTLFSGSNTVLSASKDILIGFWAKLDNGMQGSANALGIFGIGGTNVPAGGSNLTVLRAGSSDDLRLAYVDISSGFNSTATSIVMGGGAVANATYPPQWHHYGIALKKNSTTTANVTFYRDGQVFATNAHTKSLAFSRVQAIDDPVIGNYRDYLTMTGIIQSAGGWSGSLDDIFLATITTGSTQAEYNTFFSNIYNSGNFSDPTSVISSSLSSSLNPSVIFNLRFEETGGLLNLKDYGSFGNYHTATLTASSPVAPYLTTTSSGISYTPYSSLAYSASVPAGAASLSSLSYSTGEASGSVTITVNRISGSDGSLSVNYATQDFTAVSGTNYTKTTGTLSWSNADSGSKTFSVPILYDNVFTDSKNFIINLSGLSVGNYSSYPNAITSSFVTINDQEPGKLNWSTTTLSAYETASIATVNVLRQSGSFGTITADIFYSTSSMGGSPTFVESVFLVNGETSEVINISFSDDLIDESDEVRYYFFTDLSSSFGTPSTGSSGTLTFTIIDNETGSISFSGSSASVFENTSSYYVPVQRLYGGDFAATASIEFSGDAVLNTDYKIYYNSIERSSPFNITWASGSTQTQYITASIFDNEIYQPTPRDVNFSIVSSSVSIGPSSSFNLTINDYEPGCASIASSTYELEEFDSVYILVNRISGSNGSLSVNYSTLDGTAFSGTNYVKTTGTLSWSNGDTSTKNVLVSAIYDEVQASNLNFYFTLSNLSTGSFSNFPSALTSSTITLIDREPGTFKMSSSSYSVTEGQTVTLTVERYSGSFNTVEVNVKTINGTAVSGTDYNSVDSTLIFEDSEITKTFTASTINNLTDVSTLLYFNAYINSVSAVYGTALKGVPTSSVITIIDNESGSVRFVSASYTGSQNSSIAISLERYNGSDFAATASINVLETSTAIVGVDYANIFPYTVTWADQESGSKSVNITTLAPWNPSRVLNLNIGSLTNITSGTIMSSSILIQSNVLTQSSNQYSQYSTDFTINKYLNLSSEFTRRTEQVPFSLGTNPLIRLQQAYSAST